MPRRKGRRRAAGTPGQKPGKQHSSTLHLLNFQSTTALQDGVYSADNYWADAADRRRGKGVERRPNASSSSSSYSREDYVRANYRFWVRPDPQQPNSDSSALAHASSVVAWDAVQAVLLFESHDPPQSCPICLDVPVAPQVTRCGHVYCFVCILRFVEGCSPAPNDGDPSTPRPSQPTRVSSRGDLYDPYHESGSLAPCPMCETHVAIPSLRSVSFSHVVPVTIGSHLALAKLSRTSTSALALPLSYSHTPQKKLPRVSDIPEEISSFVRTAIADPPAMIDLLTAELDALTQARTLFVSMGEPENIPAADQALDLVRARLAYWQSIPPPSPPSPTPPPSSANHPSSSSTEPKTYTIYQKEDGQLVFLSPFNTRMLLKEYGSYAAFPPSISGTIVGVEYFRQTYETRKRHKPLAHLPLTANFTQIEIEFDQGILSPETLAFFASKVKSRARQRAERQRQSDLDSDRASKVREANWRTHISKPMPRYSPADFPTFDFDPENPADLPPLPSLADSQSSDLVAAPSESAPPPSPGSQYVSQSHSFTNAIRNGMIANETAFPSLSSSTPRATTKASTPTPTVTTTTPWGTQTPLPSSSPALAFDFPPQQDVPRKGKGKGKKKKKQLLFTNQVHRRG